MMDYTIMRDPDGQVAGVVRSDGACVPIDNRNGDWREFLAWNAAQAEPLDYETAVPPEPDTSTAEVF